MDAMPTPQNPSPSPEHARGDSEIRPVMTPEVSRESAPSPESNHPSADPGAAPAVMPQAVPPAITVASSDQATAQTNSRLPVSGPSTAADVDVIEPEWVDKAETVIQTHQGDPYAEEEAVEDLQRDYLKKRYGHDIADANSDRSKPGVS